MLMNAIVLVAVIGIGVSIVAQLMILIHERRAAQQRRLDYAGHDYSEKSQSAYLDWNRANHALEDYLEKNPYAASFDPELREHVDDARLTFRRLMDTNPKMPLPNAEVYMDMLEDRSMEL